MSNTITRNIVDNVCTIMFDQPKSAANVLNEKIFGELNEQLDFIEDNEGDVYITGFSKGGAMAIVIAPYLPRVKGIYCFGIPRIGNSKYAKNYPLIDNLFIFVSIFESPIKDDNPLPKPLLILNAPIMQHSQMIFLD